MPKKSASSVAVAESFEDEVLEYARYVGPGTRLYPSPRPDVRDLALPPMKWIQVDPIYNKSGNFVRDRKDLVFEYLRSKTAPVDLDLSVPEELNISLTPDQRELIKSIALVKADVLADPFISAISISDNVDIQTGFPRNNASDGIVSYLREHHRPFLVALQDMEKRNQKRQAVLSLIKKHLDRIAALPG